MPGPPNSNWPQVRTVGVDGFVVSFADSLSEPANRAALAFRDAIDRAGWEGVEESATSLVSAYLRFDPQWRDHDGMRAALEEFLQDRDWYQALLPTGRRLWRVPTIFGGAAAPQLAEAAQAAGPLKTEGAGGEPPRRRAADPANPARLQKTITTKSRQHLHRDKKGAQERRRERLAQ